MTIAKIYFDQEDYQQSINHLLDILKVDRNYNDKEAHKFIIKILDILGSSDPVSTTTRKRLQSILY